MIRSMTGFSKSEVKENGISAVVEIKSLNGRYLEISCRTPRNLTHKEFEIREMLKKNISRGTIHFNVTVDKDTEETALHISNDLANEVYSELQSMKKALKIRDAVRLEHILHFSSSYYQKSDEDTSEAEWNVVKKAIVNAIRSLNRMRTNEGNQISKDINARMKKLENTVEKVEQMGLDKIPAERERLRQRVAKLFESDEIDEHRLQTELVLLADKLDISEECVRLRSHIKFYYETFKSKEPIGKKINFLLQEMNREVNTIGSKCNDADISQNVVFMKEELERVREQIQNME
jgi:uncharacterized protein (TIGR00255 family)